jgi:uncharacterized membrane protein
MGIATVYFVPSLVEPFLWLGIFLLCAYRIAGNSGGKYFIHGLFVSLVNSVWITASHVILFPDYASHHPEEMAMMNNMPLPDSPRLMMIMTGPVVGLISGIVLGLFAFIASKIVRPKSA